LGNARAGDPENLAAESSKKESDYCGTHSDFVFLHQMLAKSSGSNWQEKSCKKGIETPIASPQA